MDCEHAETRQECRVDQLHAHDDGFDVGAFLGDWYPCYTLRHDRDFAQSAHMHVDRLDDGNLKIYVTGSRSVNTFDSQSSLSASV